MSEKPTYEELEKRVQEFEQSEKYPLSRTFCTGNRIPGYHGSEAGGRGATGERGKIEFPVWFDDRNGRVARDGVQCAGKTG